MDEHTVITLLNEANGTNLNNASRQSATQRLMSMQIVSGYPSTLLNVWQSSQPDTLREIALVQFKNHAVNNFKQTGNSQEKEHCKKVLLNSYLNEKSEQVSKQISQCIAKLARREWPKNWQSLFQILASNIKKDDAICVLRTALIIADILQEIGSMRLPQQTAQIQDLSKDLMPILFTIWTKAFTFAFSQFESQQNCDLHALYKCLKLCLFLSKSIQVLIRKSFDIDLSLHSVTGQYMNKSLDVIQKLHDRYYIQLVSVANKTAILKDIVQSMNAILKTLLRTTRDTHLQFTLQFRLILPSYLSYYTHLIIRNKQRKQNNFVALNEVIVEALLFLYDVCKAPQYKGKNVSGIQFNKKGVHFNQMDADECKLIVTNFFNQDRLRNIIQCLVSDLFVLTRSDLEDRSVDPCAKWQQHHIEHNNDNIRAAAKQLFRILVKQYCAQCAPVIVDMFKSITAKKSNINLNTLHFKALDPENEAYREFFLKEAVYLALGLKYWNISPYLAKLGCKFSTIGEILSADLKLYGKDNGYRVPFLCSRILWLFGKLKEDINKENDRKQYVYNAILKHLEHIKTNDVDLENHVLLLRLDAAEALYRLLDDNAFEAKHYQHLLQRTFRLLLQLVNDCDGSLECMQDILRYISITIKQNAATLSGEGRQTNDDINNEEIVHSIFTSMGMCWDNCSTTETNLCRVNLIECITHLIGCMRSINVHKLYSKLIPMIAYCTESTDDDARICLIDQGLELWHKVLYHSYKLETKMDALFSQNWIPQMKTNADFFEILMSILKSYLFLGGGSFVQSHAADIGNTLECVVPDITDLEDSFSKITDVLCVFVQLFPAQSPQFLFPVIQHLVKDFLQCVARNNEGNHTTDQFSPQFVSTLRIECYMLFFCRLLLVNTEGTLNILNKIQENENAPNLIQTLFQSMFSVKQKVKQFYKQKIVVLGLLKIFCGVTANDNNLLVPLWMQLLPWFVSVIRDTEIDCLEFAEDMHPDMGSDDDQTQWTEADRISNLYCNDMVSHTFMIDVVLKTLNESANKLNLSMQNLLLQICATKKNLADDCKFCIDKYKEYLKDKN